MLNTTLLRQLRKCGLSEQSLPADSAAWSQLLEIISRAYGQMDQDRLLMDRAMELSTTEMNQLHAELAQYSQGLEQQVQQRTAQLTEAKIAAESSSRAKSDFLATMSHEIRTPLNGVIGMVELVARSPLSEKQRQHLEMAKNSAWSLTRIIGDILDFSKIEAGKLELWMTDLDIRSLVRQTVAQFNIRAEQKGVRLIEQLDESIPSQLRGDPDRLRQILVNLVGNAVKFTASGSITVVAEADTTSAGENRKRVRFSVRDTGAGITSEQIGRLFKAFSQADSSTTRNFGGTGLGLAIAKQLTNLMGGEIGVISTPGEGSTFWFTAEFESSCVPAVVRDQTESAASRLPDEIESRDPLRILIADDNEINQMLTQEILRLSGCQSDIAEDGRKALIAAASVQYDLILMDCQMPELDGFSATQQIRLSEADGTRHVPIIALTANAVKGDRERCLAAGMDDYLSKPIDPDELVAMVERYTTQTTPRVPPISHQSARSARSAA